MTPQNWFNQYQGTAISVDGIKDNFGQCVQAVDSYLIQVFSLPEHYGNAIDWWSNPGDLLHNFDKITDGSIKAGDFIVYDARVGSVFGHIDVAAQDGTIPDFVTYDSNWDAKHFHDSNGYPTLHEVHHNDIYNTYILGSLRRKGSNMDTPPVNSGDVDNFWPAMTGHAPTDADHAVWDNGKDWKTFGYDKVWPEMQSMRDQINNLTAQLQNVQQVNKQTVTDYINKNLS